MIKEQDNTDNCEQDISAGLYYRRLAERSAVSGDTDDNWLITMSDVFSLLLVFFIIFIVTAKNMKESDHIAREANLGTVLPGSGLIEDLAPVREKIRDEISTEIKNHDLGKEISVLSTNSEIIVTMKEKVSFSPAEAGILEGSKPVLAGIASVIRKYPSFFVEIEGHTDSIPISTPLYPSNWELSVARAASVLRYFTGEQSVDPSRLSIKGSADKRPVAPNDTPENRALNRRVEIRLKEKA